MNSSLIQALAGLQTQDPFVALYEPSLGIGFLVCVLGYILSVTKHTEDYGKALIRLMMVTVFIAAIPLWTSMVRDVAYFLPLTLIDYHTGLNSVYSNIAIGVSNAVSRVSPEFSFLDLSVQTLMDWVAAMGMRIVATIGSVFAVPLLFVQILLEKFLINMMPLMLALFMVPSTRSIAQGYISFWVSVLLWPLGFAVVTVMAGAVFTVSDGLGTRWADIGSGGGFIANFLAPFTAGAILIGGTLMIPPLMYSLCAHGGAAVSGPSPLNLARSAVTFSRR